MVITLTGNNSYQLAGHLSDILGKYSQKYGEFAVEKLEASEVELPAIIEAVQATPFLSKRKLVVINGLSQNSVAAGQIEQIIDSISESVDVVIYDLGVDRRSLYFKVLKERTKLEEFREIDSRDLPKWLVAEVKKQGGEINFAEANYLIERLGPNQQLIASELDKLITYKPKISREIIDLLTEATPQSRIFDLLDAAFQADKAKSLRLYDDQRAQKVEPQAILAMLAWQLRLIVIAKTMGQRSFGTVSKEMGVSEYPLKKAKSLADKIDQARLKMLVDEALEIDVRAKTSAMDLDEALKTYIVSL